jgi:CRISPR-associated protein Cas2
MIEIQTGVFVGTVSALVRDLLWSKCAEKVKEGRCCQVYRTNTEQGFSMRMLGDSTRQVVDLDGLYLVGVKNARWKRLGQESS